jgi:hypothetical protein
MGLNRAGSNIYFASSRGRPGRHKEAQWQPSYANTLGPRFAVYVAAVVGCLAAGARSGHMPRAYTSTRMPRPHLHGCPWSVGRKGPSVHSILRIYEEGGIIGRKKRFPVFASRLPRQSLVMSTSSLALLPLSIHALYSRNNFRHTAYTVDRVGWKGCLVGAAPWHATVTASDARISRG